MAVYHYESRDGRFSDIEVVGKGRTFEMVERAFADFAPNQAARGELVRTTRPDWFNVFLLHDSVTNRRWSLPYEARPRRTRE